MKKRIFGVVLVLIAGAATSYFLNDKSTTPYKSRKMPKQSISVVKPKERPANEMPAPGAPDFAAAKAGEGKNAGKENIYKMFQTDDRGNLVLNENARLNIEKLHALNTPEELDAKLQQLSTVLPSMAHRQLVHLIDYFDKYTRDSMQIYPPERAPSQEEELLEQLQVLHILRVKHFGSDVATALFAEEEALNLQLLELMQKEKDKNITLGERVQRAQQHIKSK